VIGPPYHSYVRTNCKSLDWARAKCQPHPAAGDTAGDRAKGGTTTDEHRSRRDPARSSATADRLVAAARAVLTRGGPRALTVQAVAEEAGTYPDAVRYHFGGKAGLISAVVESLANDQGFRAIARATGTAPRAEVVHRLVEADHDLLLDDDSYRDFYALLSPIVLDDELRARVALLYQGFRSMYGAVVGSEAGFSDDQLHALETLMIAVVDGLAVQKLLDPDSVRLDVVLPFWEDVLRLVFERSAASG
jgi:AcrR family transcriptional regulator